MKKYIFLVAIVLIGLAVYSLISNNPSQSPLSFNSCYIKETESQLGYDKSYLFLSQLDSGVTGFFENFPAGKDSKTGSFEGVLEEGEDLSGMKKYTLWWNSFAEGMNVTEQLIIQADSEIARVGFGAMVDRGDGVYVYENRDLIPYWQELESISCDGFSDKRDVEKYVRENIGSLAPEDPVLGGSWYALDVMVDPETQTGEFGYEDGHIQGYATFSYIRNGENIQISNISAAGS